MNPDDLQQSFDDIQTQFDDVNQNLQDYFDSNDSNLSDIQTTIDDLTTNEGQLTFPLSQDSIDLITEQTPAMLNYLYNNNYIGTVALVTGTKVVANSYVTANSLILLSRSLTGGTLGHLSYTATAGSFTINSSSATDTSTIIYFIIN